MFISFFFFFSSRRRHTRCSRDWSSDVCSSDLDSQPIVDLAALTTHPGGVVSATQPLGQRPFGTAVSRHGVVYVTRLDAESLGRAKLPHTTFSDGVTVGSVPTDVAFTHDGKTAYVANQFSDNVGVVDVGRDTQVDVIPVIGDPFDVIVDRKSVV